MKIKAIATCAVCFLFVTSSCFAQRTKKAKSGEVAPAPAEEAAPEEQSVVTEECLMNISLFNESAKNRQFAEAYTPWLKAYTECPGANRAIYTQGRNILHWKIQNETDEAAKRDLRNQLMGMYDNRIKYFGHDQRYPKSYILGLKALDYITFFPEDQLKKEAYGWLEEAINGQKGASEVEVLRQFAVLSDALYKNDAAHAEKYINDYLKVSEYLNTIVADPSHRSASIAEQVKLGLDGLFVQSGVADCDALDGIYRAQVEANKKDNDFLNRVILFYKRTGCTSSEVYFSASVASHQIAPSEESANGCAEMAYKKEDYRQAIAYYEEAVNLAADNNAKADYLYKIAAIQYSQYKAYGTARTYARRSLEANPTQGRCHILIGSMYAQSKVFDDPVLNKAVFWVAVDEFVKAKRIDPSCAADADQLISLYSRHFPTNEEIFFQPEMQSGKSFYVGGWIGESTTCR